jgi:hypothetical protein
MSYLSKVKSGLTRPQFNKHRAMLQKHFRKFDAGFFWE